MTTIPKFAIGQRVEMSEEALAARLDGGRKQCRTGIVMDFYPVEQKVLVLRDGTKRPIFNHYSRWQPLTEAIADERKYCPTCGQRLP